MGIFFRWVEDLEQVEQHILEETVMSCHTVQQGCTRAVHHTNTRYKMEWYEIQKIFKQLHTLSGLLNPSEHFMFLLKIDDYSTSREQIQASACSVRSRLLYLQGSSHGFLKGCTNNNSTSILTFQHGSERSQTSKAHIGHLHWTSVGSTKAIIISTPTRWHEILKPQHGRQ